MSQQKTFEAATIEAALRAVSMDLGDDIEVVDAKRERHGGLFGFFAKERFVVTARSSASAEVREPDFGDLLLSLADRVDDTWEPSDGHEDASQPPPVPPVEELPEPVELTSVIDLRAGRRTIRAVPAGDGRPGRGDSKDFTFRSDRPSQLRRRFASTEEPAVLRIATPPDRLEDTAPPWSIERLRGLGLPEALLEVVQAYEPDTDVEWLHAVSLAIEQLLPEEDENTTWLVGNGRASAVELVVSITRGRCPAVIVVHGRQIAATPDELAFSLRECLR